MALLVSHWGSIAILHSLRRGAATYVRTISKTVVAIAATVFIRYWSQLSDLFV